MTLVQLRALCAIVDSGLHLSAAARLLNKSQPALSREVQALERDLGTSVFHRKRNRILELTPAGELVLAAARRTLAEAEAVRHAALESASSRDARLTIATTHTQARYTLPSVIRGFMKRHPQVALELRQGTPIACAMMVARGEADFAVCMDVAHLPQEVVHIPCYRVERGVIVPPRHPLLKVKPLTLEALARYPLITLEAGASGRQAVEMAFSSAGLSPRIVCSALDADVSKTYVEVGLGVAVLASIAFRPRRDTGLRMIPASALFAPNVLGVVVRKGSLFRRHLFEFVHGFAPSITRAALERALAGQRPAADVSALPVQA